MPQQLHHGVVVKKGEGEGFFGGVGWGRGGGGHERPVHGILTIQLLYMTYYIYDAQQLPIPVHVGAGGWVGARGVLYMGF